MKRITMIFMGVLITLNLTAQIKLTTSNVNLRSGPGMSDSVLCVIPKGSGITVLNNDFDDWTYIQYRERKGYVNNDYIRDVSQSSSYDYNTSGNEIKYYYNSKGEKVQSPTYYKSPPSGATAECRDGTYSFSRSRRGTCSHHGGVKRWL